MANNNHFELTLDTLAPTGSISGLKEFEKENKALTIVGGDATFKKVWFDDLNKTEVSKDCDGYKNAEWEAKDIAVTSAFNETGVYYYHLVLMDDVNNESEIYTLGPISYDQDAPVVMNVHIEDSRGDSSNTNETTLKYSFEYSDIGSGAYQAIIDGDIEGDLDARTILLVSSAGKYEGTFDLKKDAAENKVIDGEKSITVTVYDTAGNASAVATSNVILLDRDLDKPTLLIKKDGANIPAYINYRDFVACLSSAETNIAAYKIWEGSEEPEAWVEQEVGTLNVEVPMTFSANDGEKVIYAKVRDVAGNVVEAESRKTSIDSKAPVAEIVSDKKIISKVATFDKAILTFGATADNENGSGIEYYEIRRNGEKIAFGDTLPANYEVTVGTLEDGLYEYTLMVRDRAKNETVSSEAAKIIMDTKSPELSIVALNAWYTDKFNAKVSYSDDNAFGYMYAWSSTIANDETLPGNKIASNPTTNISSGNIVWDLAQSEANYLHVMLSDEVGNVAIAHAKFGYDTVAPEIKTCQFTKGAFGSVNATINLTYEDATSGVTEMRISGDITDGTPANTWEKILPARNVTLTTGDGAKRVLVEIRDAAGLVSTKEITCELDTTTPMPVAQVYEADGINIKADHSPLATFGLRIEVQQDDRVGGVQYKIYGDFNQDAQAANGITEADAPWVDFIEDEGKTYMSISNLYCTKGDGRKEIYVKIQDNAGNIGTLTGPLFFDYDTTPPTVYVDAVDYNRISKVHVERRSGSNLIVGAYADEVHFTLVPDSEIQAYKVCAYINASAAAAVEDVASEVAIGTAHGSIHMAGTGLDSKAEIKATIKGADYEAALGEVGKVDGAHIVVVYVQDLAGTWSIAAQFNQA